MLSQSRAAGRSGGPQGSVRPCQALDSQGEEEELCLRQSGAGRAQAARRSEPLTTGGCKQKGHGTPVATGLGKAQF